MTLFKAGGLDITWAEQKNRLIWQTKARFRDELEYIEFQTSILGATAQNAYTGILWIASCERSR